MYYRGCWHIVSRCFLIRYRQGSIISYATFSSLTTAVYNPQGLHPARCVAPSDFRPLWNIPYCCLPQESGPYLSPSVADQSLNPAKHHRLGGPLPHQLANVAHSDLLAKQTLPFILLSCKNNKYSVLSDVSIRYPNLKGTLSTCYSPIRRYDIAIIARHACIRHTASVHPEPGSNSRKN